MIRLSTLPLLLALAACTTENYSVVILRNVKPNAECVVAGDPNAVGLSFGNLDVTTPLPDNVINPGYLFTPVIQNSTAATPETSMVGNPNSHLFFMRGAEVELVAGPTSDSQVLIDYLAGLGLTKRTQRFSTSIPPNGASGIAFIIIDDEQTAAINDVLAGGFTQIVARVTVFGVIDDSNLSTPVFEYPVTLCQGCLVKNFASCDIVPDELREIDVCNGVQEKGYICCNTGTQIVCPPPPKDQM
jgi:hypothetical protein